MATRSGVRAALATVEAADAAVSLADLPGLLLPALMETVGAESAVWTELDLAAGPLPVRIVRCPEPFADEAAAATPGWNGPDVPLAALAMTHGPLHVYVSLYRARHGFSPAQVDLLAQLWPLLTRRLAELAALPADPRPVPAVLTARQQQVLSLVAEGLTDAAIAHRLGCRPRTVDKHLEHIYRKLGVSCRTAAIAASGA
jgi:DNA-binding CsgD family transcriptional regulator